MDHLSQKNLWEKLLQYTSTYPSPHNSQPIKVKIIDERTAEIYYDKRLGFPAGSYGMAFEYISAGIFLETLSIAAQNMEYSLYEHLLYDDIDFSSPNPLHLLGTIVLLYHPNKKETLSLEDIQKRQTSRLRYSKKLVPEEILVQADQEAERFGQTFHLTTEKALIKDIMAVKKRALFYDLAHKPVRDEMRQYIRYSRKEAFEKGDGISAESLGVSPLTLKLVMSNQQVWSWPLVGPSVKKNYLRSLKHVSQLAWLTGPFNDNADYLHAGRCFIRIWLTFTKNNVSLHPFGSVITNPRAHQEFCDLVQEEEKDSIPWMLFRFGYSKQPPKAHRRNIEAMLLAQ